VTEERKRHWNGVFSKKGPEDLTWFQPRPASSLSLIRKVDLPREARILDVGGGASLLTSFLFQEGYRGLSVLDVSGVALGIAKEGLGEWAGSVEWLEADVTRFEPPHRWDLWHDRAAFHFMTTQEDRAAYLRTLNASVEIGGHVIIATFAPDGPDRCSGLDCLRYSPEGLLAVLGEDYELAGSISENHLTPTGGTQKFVYSWFRRRNRWESPV